MDDPLGLPSLLLLALLLAVGSIGGPLGFLAAIAAWALLVS